jgi:hypothetical protein
MIDEYVFDMKKVKKMYRKLYWSQIFNRYTTWKVKKIAIKSLFIMRKYNDCK